jgi:CRISPR-associated protein Csx16
MTTYFVSRHPGAQDWAREAGIRVDVILDHLDPALVEPGDRVLGSLPVNLAAAVCARGGRYLHLTLELPRAGRGRELTAEDMRAYGARIEEYQITRRP